MIEVENIVFEYPGKRALKDVSFTIEPGSITALVGPNGAGKTTLLRCIAALDEPFSGHIRINDINVQEQPREIHQQVGYLSDFFGLYNQLTVRQCLTFIAKIHQIPPERIEKKLILAAERLEIINYLDVKAGTLSRGLRQRLGIAQAILHEPQLLLLDEPASGLDPEARVTLSDLFLSLQKAGMTLIVSSHILTELEDYCTEMLLLRDGRILEHCKTRATALENRHQVDIRLLTPGNDYQAQLTALPFVEQVKINHHDIVLTVCGDDTQLHEILKTMLVHGVPVCGFSVHQKKLQDIYMDHT